ncbi:potassium:proton antiporter [Aureococcus anophagefferens]|nr:potassium:proton antiporter [Aureococcus anophagefferens]
MAAQEEVLREVHLKVDTRFALVKVLGEAGQEARDKNMPRNLHNAAELFLRCGMVDQAEKLQKTTSDMLDIYATNPDGSSHSMGRAAKGGEDVPWIQKKALSPEEKRRKDEAARAAKRAEVEANVRAAMAARKAAAAS